MNETAEQVIALEDRYQLQSYAKLPVAIERGEGCVVFDFNGNRFLDLYGGHCVVSTGHCHPRVVSAIRNQAAQLLFYSNATYSSIRARAVQRLMSLAGEPYHQAFLVNSGSEANENAIKLARAFTGRPEIISTEYAFHGRTYGSLSATGIQGYRQYLNTPVPHHTVVPVEEVASRVSEKTAGVLLEPIQSMGGIRVIPVETLRAIESACRRHGTLLVFDEIQTGVGRTGEFLYATLVGVYPDLVTLAKGLASGLPAAAVLLTEVIARQVRKGDLGSTFGGGPLASAAIDATLEVIQEEGLCENARAVGAYLKEGLLSNPVVSEVRGEGLLLGIVCAGRSAKDVQAALFRQGILAGTSNDPAVLRLMPPLTLSTGEAEEFLRAMREL